MLKHMIVSQIGIQLIIVDRIEMRMQLCCLFGDLTLIGMNEDGDYGYTVSMHYPPACLHQ